MVLTISTIIYMQEYSFQNLQGDVWKLSIVVSRIYKYEATHVWKWSYVRENELDVTFFIHRNFIYTFTYRYLCHLFNFIFKNKAKTLDLFYKINID